MNRRKRSSKDKRAADRRRRALATGVVEPLPKAERLKPVDFVARVILTIKSAPRQRVVDVALDTVCQMHGYIPMRVLTYLVDEGLVFVDDSRPPHKVIGLTPKGKAMGEERKISD